MANYFVDSTTGNDGDNGTTMDLAFATLDYAVTSGGISAGDIIWVRRLHSETPTSHLTPAYNGTHENPIRVIGWPRALFSITSATWTNGSTTVDAVIPGTLSRERHLGRLVTGPDGFVYFITRIIDANTFIIDRLYAGVSVSGVSGVASIHTDEHWVDDIGTAYGFDDSGWTIKETAWDADADDLPLIDFDTGAFYLSVSSGDNWHWHNLDVQNGASSTGLIVFTAANGTPIVQGCIAKKTANNPLVNMVVNSAGNINRCVFVGSGTGSSQWNYLYGRGVLSNVAIYNMGDSGIVMQPAANVFLENVNVGVEQPNSDDDLYIVYGAIIKGRDVKFGDSLGAHTFGAAITTMAWLIEIENWEKVLGSHFISNAQGTIVNTAVVDGSGDPEQRTSGSSMVIEILYDRSHTTWAAPSPYALALEMNPVFVHEFEATTDSKSYRYFVQAEGAVAADELWLEVEYVDSYDDTTKYTMTKVTSDEAITARADASDWSQYIEVTSIQPAVASKVRIKCYCSYYHATNKIYIDPLAVIT
ncbi:MAG: hypothetical protein ACW99G_23600 [Candidatus Thorarchaeota archaeon]|jgi:hypothetical protein